MKPQIVMSMSNNIFTAQYRIYYEDTDSGGVVYYANYLKFFERARTDFLRSLGISQSQLAKDENLIFVVRKCEIEYLSPARLDDLISISVLINSITGIKINMLQEIKLDNKIISKLNVDVVCLDSINLKPKKFDLRNLFKLQNAESKK